MRVQRDALIAKDRSVGSNYLDSYLGNLTQHSWLSYAPSTPTQKSLYLPKRVYLFPEAFFRKEPTPHNKLFMSRSFTEGVSHQSYEYQDQSDCLFGNPSARQGVPAATEPNIRDTDSPFTDNSCHTTGRGVLEDISVAPSNESGMGTEGYTNRFSPSLGQSISNSLPEATNTVTSEQEHSFAVDSLETDAPCFTETSGVITHESDVDCTSGGPEVADDEVTISENFPEIPFESEERNNKNIAVSQCDHNDKDGPREPLSNSHKPGDSGDPALASFEIGGPVSYLQEDNSISNASDESSCCTQPSTIVILQDSPAKQRSLDKIKDSNNFDTRENVVKDNPVNDEQNETNNAPSFFSNKIGSNKYSPRSNPPRALPSLDQFILDNDRVNNTNAAAITASAHTNMVNVTTDSNVNLNNPHVINNNLLNESKNRETEVDTNVNVTSVDSLDSSIDSGTYINSKPILTSNEDTNTNNIMTKLESCGEDKVFTTPENTSGNSRSVSFDFSNAGVVRSRTSTPETSVMSTSSISEMMGSSLIASDDHSKPSHDQQLSKDLSSDSSEANTNEVSKQGGKDDTLLSDKGEEALHEVLKSNAVNELPSQDVALYPYNEKTAEGSPKQESDATVDVNKDQTNKCKDTTDVNASSTVSLLNEKLSTSETEVLSLSSIVTYSDVATERSSNTTEAAPTTLPISLASTCSSVVQGFQPTIHTPSVSLPNTGQGESAFPSTQAPKPLVANVSSVPATITNSTTPSILDTKVTQMTSYPVAYVVPNSCSGSQVAVSPNATYGKVSSGGGGGAFSPAHVSGGAVVPSSRVTTPISSPHRHSTPTTPSNTVYSPVAGTPVLGKCSSRQHQINALLQLLRVQHHHEREQLILKQQEEMQQFVQHLQKLTPVQLQHIVSTQVNSVQSNRALTSGGLSPRVVGVNNDVDNKKFGNTTNDGPLSSQTTSGANSSSPCDDSYSGSGNTASQSTPSVSEGRSAQQANTAMPSFYLHNPTTTSTGATTPVHLNKLFLQFPMNKSSSPVGQHKACTPPHYPKYVNAIAAAAAATTAHVLPHSLSSTELGRLKYFSRSQSEGTCAVDNIQKDNSDGGKALPNANSIYSGTLTTNTSVIVSPHSASKSAKQVFIETHPNYRRQSVVSNTSKVLKEKLLYNTTTGTSQLAPITPHEDMAELSASLTNSDLFKSLQSSMVSDNGLSSSGPASRSAAAAVAKLTTETFLPASTHLHKLQVCSSDTMLTILLRCPRCPHYCHGPILLTRCLYY